MSGFLSELGTMLRQAFGPPPEVEEEPRLTMRSDGDTSAARIELKAAASHLKDIAQATTRVSGGAATRGYVVVGDQFHDAMQQLAERVK